MLESEKHLAGAETERGSLCKPWRTKGRTSSSGRSWGRLVQIDARIDGHDEQFARLWEGVKELRAGQTDLSAMMDRVDDRFSGLRSDLESQFGLHSEEQAG